MFCENCGSEVPAGSVFCENCGQKAVSDKGSEIPKENTIPQYTPQVQDYVPVPPVQQSPVYPQPVALPKKKKKHTVLKVFLVFLIIVGAAVVAFFAVTSWSAPKDLGIRYTQADYNRVIMELGIHFTADFGNGDSYDNKDILAGSETATGYFNKNNEKTVKVEKLNYKDYNWEFSKYEKKTIKASDVEATAVFNESAPPFFWLTDSQVKIEPDGSIKFSSALNVRMIIRDLFQSIEEKIPIKLPKKLNIYLEGVFSVKNDIVSAPPTKASAGIFTVPEKYLTNENIASAMSYFTDLFEELNLDISVESLYIENGEFYFVGVVPTEVRITPKNVG